MQKKGAYRFASGIAVFAPLFYLALNSTLVAFWLGSARLFQQAARN